jgi:hypothetical protein
MRAIGFHGTNAAAAQRILASGFAICRNEYDWLGDGAYFFHDAQQRALEWARTRFGSEAAVLGAEIDLIGCLDLLDVGWQEFIQASYEGAFAQIRERSLPLPRQTAGAHRLDRHVLNHAMGVLGERGVPVRSVRAAFIEGAPLFPGSALWSRAHVQIAVRDPNAILNVWLVPSSGG